MPGSIGYVHNIGGNKDVREGLTWDFTYLLQMGKDRIHAFKQRSRQEATIIFKNIKRLALKSP